MRVNEKDSTKYQERSASKTQRHFMHNTNSSVEKLSQSTSSPHTNLRIKPHYRVNKNSMSMSRKPDSFKNFTFIQDRPVRDTFMDHLPSPHEQRFVSKESIEKFKGDSKYKREKMLVNLGNQMKTIQFQR